MLCNTAFELRVPVMGGFSMLLHISLAIQLALQPATQFRKERKRNSHIPLVLGMRGTRPHTFDHPVYRYFKGFTALP